MQSPSTRAMSESPISPAGTTHVNLPGQTTADGETTSADDAPTPASPTLTPDEQKRGAKVNFLLEGGCVPAVPSEKQVAAAAPSPTSPFSWPTQDDAETMVITATPRSIHTGRQGKYLELTRVASAFEAAAAVDAPHDGAANVTAAATKTATATTDSVSHYRIVPITKDAPPSVHKSPTKVGHRSLRIAPAPTAEDKPDQKPPADKRKKNAYILDPEHKFHRWWLFLTIVVIFANAWSVPFRLSMGYMDLHGGFTSWNGADIVFDVWMYANIALKTRLAFYQGGALVTDPQLIWARYFGVEFAIDVVSLLPIDWLLLAGGFSRASVFCRLLRLLQLLVVARYLNELESSPSMNVTFIRLLKVFVFYMIVSHIVGCIWFTFALPDHFGEHEWLPEADLPDMSYPRQYLRALYWGLAMLSDRIEHPNPYTGATAGFILSVQICGIMLLSYVIGSIQSSIDAANETFQEFREQVDYVTRFMKHAKVPHSLQQRVISYYTYSWNLNRGFDDFAMLKDLPSTLRTDVCLQLTESTIGHDSLFQGLDVHFLHALVKVLLQRTLVPDEYVIREGEPAEEMYFIRSGIIVITVAGRTGKEKEAAHRRQRSTRLERPNSPTGSTARIASGPTPSPRVGGGSTPAPAPVARQVQTCVDGDSFGEFAVLLDNCPVRTSSAMAVTYCDLFVLVKSDLANLLSFYPHVQVELESRAQKRRHLALRKEQNILGLAGEDQESDSTARTGGGGTGHTKTDSVAHDAAAKAHKMKQLLGASSGDAGDSEIDLNAATTIKVAGKPIDPSTRRYRILMWLRTYWLTNSPTYELWTRFIFAISVYNALLVPFRLAFVFDVAPAGLLVVDYLGDTCLIANVFAHFWLRQPPKMNNQLLAGRGGDGGGSGVATVYEEFSVARWRYFRSGWLAWDVLTALPLDFIMLYTGMNPWFRVAKWLRFFTDARVLSVAKLQSSGLDISTIGLMQLLTGFLMLTHWASCAYWSFTYWVGYSLEPAGTEWLPSIDIQAQGVTASYLISQFQSMMLLTGFGQKIPPKGDAEICFVLFMILTGILLVAWAIGEVGELIANLDRFSADFGRQMHNTSQFMRLRHFDQGIQKRVRNYLSHSWSTRHGVDPHEAMSGLPAGLRTEMMTFLCHSLLQKVPLFARLMADDPSFGRHLIDRITFESYPSMEYIFQAGEIGDAMFFVTEGEVGIIVPEDESASKKHSLHARAQHEHSMHRAPSKIVGVGSFFGEGALLTNGLRAASVRAMKPTDLLVLSRANLWEMMEAHPDFAAHLREISATRSSKMTYLRTRVHEQRRNSQASIAAAAGAPGTTSLLGDDHFCEGMEYAAEISRSHGHLHVHGPYHQAYLDQLQVEDTSVSDDDADDMHSPLQTVLSGSERAAAILLASDPDDALADLQNRNLLSGDESDVVAIDVGRRSRHATVEGEMTLPIVGAAQPVNGKVVPSSACDSALTPLRAADPERDAGQKSVKHTSPPSVGASRSLIGPSRATAKRLVQDGPPVAGAAPSSPRGSHHPRASMFVKANSTLNLHPKPTDSGGSAVALNPKRASRAISFTDDVAGKNLAHVTSSDSSVPRLDFQRFDRNSTESAPSHAPYIRGGAENVNLQQRVPFTPALGSGRASGAPTLSRHASLDRESPRRALARATAVATNPPAAALSHRRRTLRNEDQPADRIAADSSATGGGGSTESMSAFTQARRVHANRAIETAVRDGVIRGADELAQVVQAVETRLSAEEIVRRAAQQAPPGPAPPTVTPPTQSRPVTRQSREERRASRSQPLTHRSVLTQDENGHMKIERSGVNGAGQASS